MTDGNSNVDSSRTVTEAVALHQAGVHVITVSVGQIYNETELRAIASRNGTVGNMFHANSYDDLDALASSIQSAICNGQYQRPIHDYDSVGPPYCRAEMYARRVACMLAPGQSRRIGEYSDGTDGQTDRRQTIALRYSLDAASVKREEPRVD